MAESDAKVFLTPVNEGQIHQMVAQDYDTREWREYKCNAPRRGRAVIANFYSFKDEKHTRVGSEFDVRRLEETLGNKLKFDVDKWELENVEKNEFLNMVRREAQKKEEHTKGDCFLMVLMTHGDERGVLSAHNSHFTLNEVVAHFTGDKCSSLKGKPKIFIVQACRGGDGQGAVYVPKSSDVPQSPLEQMISLPTHADLVIANSQYEGFYSLRNKEKGSYFIQSLCNAIDHDFLKPDDEKDDLLRLFTFTSNMVALFEFNEAVYSEGDTGPDSIKATEGESGSDRIRAEEEESDSSGSSSSSSSSSSDDELQKTDSNMFCPMSKPRKKKKKARKLLASKIVKQQPTVLTTLRHLLFFRSKEMKAKA